MADALRTLAEFDGRVVVQATYDDVSGEVSQIVCTNSDPRGLLVEVRNALTWALVGAQLITDAVTTWNVPNNAAFFDLGDPGGRWFGRLTSNRALVFVYPGS